MDHNHTFNMWLLSFRLQNTRKVKPARKAASKSRNPLKVLRDREDVKVEYSEVRTNVADKEVTRLKREHSKFCLGLLHLQVGK